MESHADFQQNIPNGERRGKDGDMQHSRGRMLRLMNGRNGDSQASKLSPSIKGEGSKIKYWYQILHWILGMLGMSGG